MLQLAIGVMTSLFGKVLLPSLKSHAEEGGDVKKEYLNTLGIISLLNFPAAILLIFFSEPIVRVLWSETWIMVADFLPYIGILIMTQTLNSTTGNIFVLYGKENMLLRISIPTDIVVVIAIVVGSFFSVLDVLRFYALAFIAIDIPVVIYWGFIKSFGYDMRTMLLFWVPKVVLSILLVLSIWLEYKMGTIGLMFLYFLHLVIDQRSDIHKTFGFLLKKAGIKKG